MKQFIIIFIVSNFFLTACNSSSEKSAEHQRMEDSIKKAEAEALQQEAIVAERMLDSTEAANKDTTKAK